MRPSFVDCHSHVVPSGDDGAKTVAHGIALCASAAAHGTGVLYATPHVWPELPLTDERETRTREAFAAIKAVAPLDLRLGWELTPAAPLLDEDPARYVLEGTDRVLVEIPFIGPGELLVAVAEHIEGAGLRPVIAHPERTQAVLERPSFAEELAERGWDLQVNATSLLGRHGAEPEAVGWRFVRDGLAAVVASDGHRETRPAHLDAAYERVRGELGARAAALFDGSALGVSPRRPASRAASRGA